MHQQQLTVQGGAYYCKLTKSQSIKLLITYPSNIQNLAYNFELTIIVSIQKLFPSITYNHVLTQTIYTPQREIVLNNLTEKTMYQLKVRINKSGNNNSKNQGLNEQKTLFVFTQGKSEKQQLQNSDDDNNNQIDQFQQQQQNHQNRQQSIRKESYSQLVRQNIKDYFNQYHPKQSYQQQQQSLLSQLNDHHQHSKNMNNLNNLSNNKSSLISNNNNSNVNHSFNYHPSSSAITTMNKTTKNNHHTKNKLLCNSQTMIKLIGENDPLINNKKLQKYILQARQSSSTKDYLTTKHYQSFNHMNNLYKNQQKRRQHIQKTLLIAKSVNMFGEIYKQNVQLDMMKSNENSGRQFFNNNWFMGPFYSYDQNQTQLKNNHNVNNNYKNKNRKK